MSRWRATYPAPAITPQLIVVAGRPRKRRQAANESRNALAAA